MSREGVLATYDAGCGRSVLAGEPSDLVQEAQTRVVIHNVLHPSQTVHVLTKDGATVLCISNDCSAWLEQGWMENEHTLDFTGRPPCAEEEAVAEVEAVPIPAVPAGLTATQQHVCGWPSAHVTVQVRSWFTKKKGNSLPSLPFSVCRPLAAS